jgi:hypothetical protein
MMSLNISVYIIHPAAQWPCGLLRNLPGCKAWLVRKADHLTTISEPVV